MDRNPPQKFFPEITINMQLESRIKVFLAVLWDFSGQNRIFKFFSAAILDFAQNGNFATCFCFGDIEILKLDKISD